MATTLEYIYQIKDRYSKKLASITKQQIKFTDAYTKSMGKLTAASVRHQEVIKASTKIYNSNKQAIARTVTELHSITQAQREFGGVANSNMTTLIRSQASYNMLLSQSIAQMNRLRVVRGGSLANLGMMNAGGRGQSMSRMDGLRGMQSQVSGMLGGVFNLRNAVMGVGAAWMTSRIAMAPLNQASFLEDQLTGYSVKLKGDMSAAKDLVDDINKKASTTPLKFRHIAKAVDGLLGMGDITKENVVGRTMMLGDIAQGDPAKLARISYAYSQILGGGKMIGNDRLQLINAGVPIKVMANAMGYTVAQFDKMQAAGLITGKKVTAAFKKMTDKGGLFYDMMVKKSKTFSGLSSTLSDNIDLTAQAIGNHMLPEAKKLTSRLIEITRDVKSWAEANKQMIGTKSREWFGRLRDSVEWVVDNFDMLLTVTKYLTYGLITLAGVNITLKIALMAVTTWTALYRTAVWLTTAAIGTYNFLIAISTFLITGQVMALRRSTAAIWLVRAATIAWSVASGILTSTLLANPITWIVIAVTALVAIIGMAIYKTDNLTDAFKIFGGVLVKTILTPFNLITQAVMQLYDLIGNIPGLDKNMEKARNSLETMMNTLNDVTTGNTSITSAGMIYDLAMSENGGSDVSSYISESAGAAATSRNESMKANIMSQVSGLIKVQADPGTTVTEESFEFDTGVNAPFSGVFQ